MFFLHIFHLGSIVSFVIEVRNEVIDVRTFVIEDGTEVIEVWTSDFRYFDLTPNQWNSSYFIGWDKNIKKRPASLVMHNLLEHIYIELLTVMSQRLMSLKLGHLPLFSL